MHQRANTADALGKRPGIARIPSVMSSTFIGAKLVMHWAHGLWTWVPEVDTLVSLGVIVVTLAAAIIAGWGLEGWRSAVCRLTKPALRP